MEFTALTSRVAEETGTDVDAVEAALPEDGAAKPKAKKPALKEGVRPVYRPYFNAGDKRVRRRPMGPPARRARRRAAAAATTVPFDRAAYETVTDIARLDAWIAEAERTGRVAIDTETTSLDPMQGELVGVSLATGPGRAAYIPLAHKDGPGDLLGGGLVAGQVPAIEVLMRLEAHAGGPGRPQDRAEPQVRRAGALSATASRSRPMTTPC